MPANARSWSARTRARRSPRVSAGWIRSAGQRRREFAIEAQYARPGQHGAFARFTVKRRRAPEMTRCRTGSGLRQAARLTVAAGLSAVVALPVLAGDGVPLPR